MDRDDTPDDLFERTFIFKGTIRYLTYPEMNDQHPVECQGRIVGIVGEQQHALYTTSCITADGHVLLLSRAAPADPFHWQLRCGTAPVPADRWYVGECIWFR
ncbi:MAG: hypothetical protein Q7R83_00820 [bacterium]|nr:hypothetical protein [bacterium]